MTRQELEEELRRSDPSMVYAMATRRPRWGEGLQRSIPGHMQAAVVRWIVLGDHQVLGGFLRALLSNDLMRTFDRADETNRVSIPGYVSFLYNYAPAGCWGSPEKVESWDGMLE